MMGRIGPVYTIARPRPIVSPAIEYLEARRQFNQFKSKYTFEDISKMSRHQFHSWRRTYIALYTAVQKSHAAIKTA
jgi:hypothetical protein